MNRFHINLKNGNQKALVEACPKVSVTVPDYSTETYNKSLIASGSKVENFEKKVAEYKESAAKNLKELDSGDLKKLCEGSKTL